MPQRCGYFIEKKYMSQNDLIRLGILLPDGSITKTKINYIAG
jgi:hypothetical protein